MSEIIASWQSPYNYLNTGMVHCVADTHFSPEDYTQKSSFSFLIFINNFASLLLVNKPTQMIKNVQGKTKTGILCMTMCFANK